MWHQPHPWVQMGSDKLTCLFIINCIFIASDACQFTVQRLQWHVYSIPDKSLMCVSIS